MQIVPIQSRLQLDDDSTTLLLDEPVRKLREHASKVVPRLGFRRIWVLNSTAQGGGVAEMLPRQISALRELGLDVEWVVLETDQPAFFRLTKRLHNMLHGTPGGAPTAEEVRTYNEVSRENADQLASMISAEDLLVVHDPQPAGVGALLAPEVGLPTLWRCHIGFDATTPDTELAWEFLRPQVEPYDRAIFSLADYVPEFLRERSAIIPPCVDPLSSKNCELNHTEFLAILSNAQVIQPPEPELTPRFEQPVLALQPDGSWAPPAKHGGSAIPFRPIILQVSRWDRLKGFEPLLEAFTQLKRPQTRLATDARHARRLELVALVLAGPDPAGVDDDPEAVEVLERLTACCMDLDPELQKQVFLLKLPMGSEKENALIVNALQRSATVVVQNSVREGFGLTATEAMWKGIPIVTSSAAGLRSQVEDGVSGRRVLNPRDPDEICKVLDDILHSPAHRRSLARAGQKRVAEHYLLFSQLRLWLDQFLELSLARRPEADVPGAKRG